MCRAVLVDPLLKIQALTYEFLLYAHLDHHTLAEPSFHQRFGHPAGSISSRAIYLCVVLPRKSSASMGTPTPVGIDNDLTPSQTSVTLWEGTQDFEVHAHLTQNFVNLDYLRIATCGKVP